ncbi:MAG: glutamate--tRNA ligase [Planctomycetota bacterium]
MSDKQNNQNPVNSMNSSRKVRVRFAPSPTGYLHIGNIRMALFNYMFAKRHNGKFILRIEDTDFVRSKKEFEQAIREDLAWLGIATDEGAEVSGEFGPYRQSERLDIYTSFANQLLEKSKAYRCYCTEEELEIHRKKALACGTAPHYDNRCRNLTQEDIERFEKEGRSYCLRFKLPQKRLSFDDSIRGHIEFDTDLLGDPVIVKSDGIPTYHFAVVIDDSMMKITHVIRGEGHISNTAIHLALFEELGYPVPQFAHMSHTKGLSKRLGSKSIRDFRNEGYVPEAIINYCALLGWSSKDGSEKFDPREKATEFELEDSKRSANTFDEKKFDWLCKQYMKDVSIEQLIPMITKYLPENISSDSDKIYKVAEAFKTSSPAKASEITEIIDIFEDSNLAYLPETISEISKVESVQVLKELVTELEMSRDALSVEQFLAVVKLVGKRTNLKGKALYHPMRLALTNRESGPELVALIPAMGRNLMIRRIKNAISVSTEHS